MDGAQKAFEEFLAGKRIDMDGFQRATPEVFLKWQNEFALLGATKFDQMKKFQFNPMRLRFPFQGPTG